MISDHSLNALEYGKLLHIISAFSHSDASRESTLSLRPLANKDDILKRQGLIHEIRTISDEGEPLRLSRFSDMAPLIEKVRPEGAILEPSELAKLIPVLNIASQISFQVGERDDLPLLTELTESLGNNADLLKILESSIDGEGNILDSASFTLSELRKRIRGLEAGIRKKLEEIMRDGKVSVFLQDDFITKRAGRWVIPVRMDSKGQVPGVVHDVSKTGESAFIEPLTIIPRANELENLIAEQKAEEIRILRSLSSRIRGDIDEIEDRYKMIVYLDVLNCIARFADPLDMRVPLFNDTGVIKLVEARHPLLAWTIHKSGGPQRAVPLDIELGDGINVMVITGPNAGGKTVAIKTIGLLLVMALSGMPIPAESSSNLPLVNRILIDIGDEQSIESSLSTFSAHVAHLSEILEKAGPGSLVLIDEFGTGTNPEEGAAIACAVLDELKNSGAFVFVTTHLTEIKGFVHGTDGIVNASMEFDNKALIPLYSIRVGEPGQSHALEIAKRYGLPDKIIESAKRMLGGMKAAFDDLIADLNEKRLFYEKTLDGLKRERSSLEESRKALDEQLSEAESRRKAILSNTYKEAADIIADTKRRMYALLDELKKKGGDKGREIMKRVENERKEVLKTIATHELVDEEIPALEDLRVGDIVFIASLGYDASIIKINAKRNRLKVRAGGLEIDVPASDARPGRGVSVSVNTDGNRSDRPEEPVSSMVNLIGMRVDEALSNVEPFLNHAALAGLGEVTIVHGIGEGVLLKAVREYLSDHPLVKGYGRGEMSGGDGATVVRLV